MDWVELYRRLSANAFLFDDPRAYESGIADAIDAVRRILEWEGLCAESRDLALSATTVADGLDLNLSATTVADGLELNLPATTLLALPE